MGNSFSDKKVIVVGAGYAGTQIAKTLDGSFDVTLIEPRPGMMHLWAAMRASVVPNWEKRTHVPLDKLLKNGKVVHQEVASVESGKVIMKDGTSMEADYIILAHGYTKNAFPCGPTDDAVDAEALMAKYKEKQQLVAAAKSILIVGGGPVGVELTGYTLFFMDILTPS